MEENEQNQELMFKAQILEKHIQELTEKTEYVMQQLLEFEEFNKNLKFLKDAKGKKMFAPLGRGVYLKSSCEDNNFFVNVGAGVIVKKTSEETASIIESQIRSFYEAKSNLMSQLELYNGMMNQTLVQIEKLNKS